MTASEIKAALKLRYGDGNATAIMFEVAYGTGRHANRHVDALVMDLWPSRGLTLHAMEIKVSKQDLKKELSDGSKSEEIAQHCDFFSLITPPGLTKDAIIPSAWGIIECDKTLRTVKHPTKTKALPIDRPFVAAMLRAITVRGVKVDEDNLRQTIRTEIYACYDADLKNRIMRQDGYGQRWKELLDAVGDVNWKADIEIIEAVRLLVRSGVNNSYEGIRRLEKELRDASDRIKKAADSIKLKEFKR